MIILILFIFSLDPPASQIIWQVILAHELISRPTRKPETSLFRRAIGKYVNEQLEVQELYFRFGIQKFEKTFWYVFLKLVQCLLETAEVG